MPHGTPDQAQSPYGQAPYGQPQYGQPPAQQPPAYAQPQYGQDQYGQNPYAQQPYQGNPGFAPPASSQQKPGLGNRIAAGAGILIIVVVGVLARGAVRHLFTHHTSSPAITFSTNPSGTATNAASGSGAAYAVGECMNLVGSVLATDSKVSCGDSSAKYKVLSVVSGVTGSINTDAKQCYSVAGNDDEIDKTADNGTEFLYCLGSTSGKHSPRRANVGDCLDVPSSSTDYYLVGCSNSSANYVVLARFDNTNDTSKCDSVSGSTETFTLSSDPQLLLCGKTR
jgi:hypothetical protein